MGGGVEKICKIMCKFTKNKQDIDNLWDKMYSSKYR